MVAMRVNDLGGDCTYSSNNYVRMGPVGDSLKAMPGAGAYLEVLQAADRAKHMNKHILRDASDYKKLLMLVEEHGEQFHVLNVCTLLHRLARCLARFPATLSQTSRAIQETAQWRLLLDLVRRHAPNCNNMELTNCLWSIATLDVRGEEETVLALLELATLHLDSFEPRNLSLSAWALAKMGNTDHTWCRNWALRTWRKLKEFETRDMTMVIWAFATVHWRDEAFLRVFCDEVALKSEDYSAQDIGNTLWGLATLSCRNEEALAALSAECFKKAEIFDQQNLSISLWSFATLDYKNMNLLHYLTQLATERIKKFGSQGIANIVWACAKFQFQQKCLLMTVAEEAIPRLDDFEPQHLAIVAWAYATLEFPNRPLLSALCRAASRKMHIFGAQHMANMTWAMATLAHKDEEYLRLLAIRALEQVSAFNPQECSNLAWAFALLTFRDEALLAALSVRSQEIVADFIPQNLGNTAWAYNRLGYRDEKLMLCLLHQAAQRLYECQGQEILDLIEAITTGDYAGVRESSAWHVVISWMTEKYERVEQFLDNNSDLPLTFSKLSEFDRALAVQDYREAMGSFHIIGLGYHNTARLLQHLGISIPTGEELEEWQAIVRITAANTRNEGDAEKNLEAQEGLKACRTICVYRFSVCVAGATECARGAPPTIQQGPIGVASGPPAEAHELGLFAGSLKHNRGGDGEFQALQAFSRACLESLGCSPLTDGGNLVGELWLHASEVPCLSCVGAMAQFRQLFPRIRMHVSYVLGRQPAAGSSGNSVSPAGPRIVMSQLAGSAPTSTESAAGSTSNHKQANAAPDRSGRQAPLRTDERFQNGTTRAAKVEVVAAEKPKEVKVPPVASVCPQPSLLRLHLLPNSCEAASPGAGREAEGLIAQPVAPSFRAVDMDAASACLNHCVDEMQEEEKVVEAKEEDADVAWRYVQNAEASSKRQSFY